MKINKIGLMLVLSPLIAGITVSFITSLILGEWGLLVIGTVIGGVTTLLLMGFLDLMGGALYALIYHEPKKDKEGKYIKP